MRSLAASTLHDGHLTIAQVKDALAARDLPVRRCHGSAARPSTSCPSTTAG